jgi:hypothetical protein
MDVDRTERAIALLEREALATHAVYSADLRHPIEVSVAEQDHLKRWLSNRLNRAVAPPDLAAIGYQLDASENSAFFAMNDKQAEARWRLWQNPALQRAMMAAVDASASLMCDASAGLNGYQTGAPRLSSQT